MEPIEKHTLDFLLKLEQNNNRDWFNEHKEEFRAHKSKMTNYFNQVYYLLNKHDKVDSLKIFRIYRDVRFSKNKLPYKSHFAASFHRIKPLKRGGYYLHIQPNNRSFVAVGFWNPNKEDLLRIRKELEIDAGSLREIMYTPDLKTIWGSIEGEELKSAPRNFNKEHPDIDLIRKKQFIFKRTFSDDEVLSTKFYEEIDLSFRAIRPFLNYMSDILTTDLNGELLV